mgnify:CR=1 FL=1
MQTFSEVSSRQSSATPLNRHDLITPSNPAKDLISATEWSVMGRMLELSDRELDVAQRLFEGMSREQIALTLRKADGTCLSPETVRVYIDRLWRKLNVSDHMQLAIRLLRVQRIIQQG